MSQSAMSLLTSERAKIPLRVLYGTLWSPLRGTITQVLAGRNDDYGDRPVERLLACIEWNQRWLNCHTIFVEWNALEDRPLLSASLVQRFPRVCCYVVPGAIHQRIAGTHGHPFQEFHAKNVGIRRARTPWVVSMNTDILVGPDVRPAVKRLQCSRHNQTVVLRTRRVDIPFDGKTPKLTELLDGRRYLRFRCVSSLDASAPGDFTFASRALWTKAQGYDEAQVNRRVIADCRGIFQLVAHGGEVRWAGTHFHLDHPESTSHGVVASVHGDVFDAQVGVPYGNPEAWGLGTCRERQIGDRVWLLDRF